MVEKNRRILLMSLDLGVAILSFIGVLFVSIQPDKGFFLFRYSSFYGIFAIVFSIFSFFYLFFQKQEKPIDGWYIELELSFLVASLLSAVFSFGFSFPLLSGFDELSFVTSDIIYLSIGAPLLLLAKFVLTPKERKSNLFLFSLASISMPIVYFVWFLLLQYAALHMRLSDFPVVVSAYLYPPFVSPESIDIVLLLGYFALILLALYLMGVFLSLFIKRSSESEASTAIEAVVEEKKGDEPKQMDGASETNEPNPNANETSLSERKETSDIEKMENSASNSGLDAKNKQSVRVYHVSKQERSGLWQVKLASSKKAIRLFKTQAEAIKCAKDLSKRNSGSVRIHSKKGTMRKG